MTETKGDEHHGMACWPLRGGGFSLVIGVHSSTPNSGAAALSLTPAECTLSTPGSLPFPKHTSECCPHESSLVLVPSAFNA